VTDIADINGPSGWSLRSMTSIVSVLDAHHVIDDAALRRYLRAPNNAIRVDAAEQELARRGWQKVEGGWFPEGETGVLTLKDEVLRYMQQSNNTVRLQDAQQELRRRGWRVVDGEWVPKGALTLKDACDQALDESVGNGMPEGEITSLWGNG
jgi:hypothetical protein